MKTQLNPENSTQGAGSQKLKSKIKLPAEPLTKEAAQSFLNDDLRIMQGFLEFVKSDPKVIELLAQRMVNMDKKMREEQAKQKEEEQAKQKENAA